MGTLRKGNSKEERVAPHIMKHTPIIFISVFVLFINLSPVPGNGIYGSKRGRPQYSSLIPFPRVGRSDPGSQLIYYGQKRGGKSGLIPFPRVGRAGPRAWELQTDTGHEKDRLMKSFPAGPDTGDSYQAY